MHVFAAISEVQTFAILERLKLTGVEVTFVLKFKKIY
jgi:hypothetical protein